MSPTLRMLKAERNQTGGGLPEDEWPRERPDFGPKQIRSEDEIRFGMRLRECSLVPDFPTGTLTVTSKAPYYSMGGLYIDVGYDDGAEGAINLMDFSVVPTPKGRWNPSHWLEGLNEQQICSGGRFQERPWRLLHIDDLV